MSNRREHERHSVWFPVAIEAGDERGIAVSYDVSSGGLLVACPGRVEIGAEVSVTFRIARDGESRTVKGRVVRVEKNPPEVDARWKYRLAVEFLEPQPEVEALLDARKDPED